MKATIVTMTPQLAKDYLARNKENRKVNKTNLNFFINQMINGKWKENGEPIIIDKNGIIKDGQHRLIACTEAKHTFRVPIISNVNPDVMDTIDTGRNRIASDVLYLEGFKYCSLMASSIKMILSERITDQSSKRTNISNADILNYAKKHKTYIYEIISSAKKISSLQITRTLTDTIIVYYLYKYGNTEHTKTFIKNILGIVREPKTATDYVYKKLFQAKNGDIRLSLGDKQKYIERAYDYYCKGNPEVKGLKIRYNYANYRN